MDINEALKIAGAFDKYLKTSDATTINRYSKEYLKSALAYILNADRSKLWYQEMQKRIEYLERMEEEKMKNKWWQRPLFVGVVSATIAGLFAIAAGYFFGVQKTANNIPIQSNNRQYGDIYAHQIIFNENGTFKIDGTALNQATGSTVKFTAVSSDVSIADKDASEITTIFDRINNKEQ